VKATICQPDALIKPFPNQLKKISMPKAFFCGYKAHATLCPRNKGLHALNFTIYAEFDQISVCGSDRLG